MVMPAGALTDLMGNPMLGYNGTFDLDFGTLPLPASLLPLEPRGSLIYGASVPGSISSESDTDSFTLQLDAGQTVAVLANPDGSLIPTLELFDAGGVSIGSASAAAAGEVAALPAVPVTSTGVYTVTIGGMLNSAGAYSATVMLNAVWEDESLGGPLNDTIASSQPLDTSFIPLSAGADRAAVVGSTDGFDIDSASVTTYTSPDTRLRIPDQGTVTSSLTVSDSYPIADLNVLLNISHSFDADLDVTLIAPDGTRVALFNDVGGSGDNFVDTLLDDQAPTDIASASAPFTGTFRPQGQLAVFNGNDVNGVWTLEVTDDSWSNRGKLENWSIQVTDAQERADYYAFDLDTGESVTLALTATEGGNTRLAIEDVTGVTLDNGTSGPANFHAVVDDFVAPAQGTYYARVTGDAAVAYSLVATRGAVFDAEPNNDSVSAQNIDGRQAVLGAVARPDPVFVTPGSGGLDGPLDLAFGPDGNLYVTGFYNGTVHGNGDVIHRYDGVTGDFLNVFAHSQPYGEGLVFGPDGDLYFSNGNGAVVRYDGATGAAVQTYSWHAPRGLAFGPDGYLYVASIWDNVGRFNVDTGELIDEFIPTGSGGLNFAWDLVFGADSTDDGVPELLVSSTRSGEILRYDGATGAYIDQFVPAGSGGLSRPMGLLIGPDENGDGIGELYVAAGNVLRYDGATGAFIDEFVAVGEGGLDEADAITFGPDGSIYATGNNGVLRFRTPQRDLYQITLSEGDVYDVATATPLGGLNSLDPMVRVYDSSGTLITSDDNSAADGRNAQLTIAAPPGQAGTYYVEILPADQAGAQEGGEYILDVVPLVAPGPVLFIDNVSALEGDSGQTTLGFNVSLSMPADVTVNYTVEDGAATAVDGDYVAMPSGVLTFTADGPTNQMIEITVNGDATVEPHETVIVSLANASGATIANSDRATGTILNDDTAISVNDVTVFEGDDGTVDAVFTVVLSEVSGKAVGVDFAAADGTATTADNDYQPVSGSLVFQPGETSQIVSVPVVGDTKPELDESFLLDLSKPAYETDGVTIADGQGTGTITDRELGVPIAPSPGLLSWWTGDGNANDLTGSNHGSLNGGATFSSGYVDAAFRFDGVDDYLSAPTASLPVGNADRTIELWVNADSWPASGEAFLAGYGNFGSNNATYQLGTTGDRVYFSPWGSLISGPSLVPGQWYHVAVTNVGNSVTLYVDGVVVANGSFNINTPSGTSFYAGRIPGSLGDTRRLVGEIDEISVYDRALSGDEIRAIYRAGAGGKIKGPGISVTPTSGLTTSEDGAMASFSVVLNTMPSDNVSVSIASSDTSEGTVSVSDLTFTPNNWNMPQAVAITGVDDFLQDGDVPYTIVIGAATGAAEYAGLDSPDISVSNLDNENSANFFASVDVPKSIVDPHPKRGLRPATSQLVVASSGIVVGLVDVDVTIDHASMSDLSATLMSPAGTVANLAFVDGNWELLDGATFQGQSLDGTWALTVSDTVRNGLTGTLLAWSMAVTPASPLLADRNARVSGLPEVTLTAQEAQRVAAVAIQLWAVPGHVLPDADVNIRVADLPPGQLGLAWGHTVTLDVNASGLGWHVGLAAPMTDRVDLLTVVSHEIGHLLGYEHSDTANELMAATLPPGTRRLPLSAPTVMNELAGTLAASRIPVPGQRLDEVRDEYVDPPLDIWVRERQASADSNWRFLPAVSDELVDRPRRAREALWEQFFKTIAEKETDLLDDAVLDLLARATRTF